MKHIKKIFESTASTIQFDINYFEDIMDTEWDENDEITSLYEIIEIEMEDTDLGKGIEHKRAIIKDLTANKFYAFEYSSDEGRHPLSQPGLANSNPIICKEVFPHTVTKIVYKTTPQK